MLLSMMSRLELIFSRCREYGIRRGLHTMSDRPYTTRKVHINYTKKKDILQHFTVA